MLRRNYLEIAILLAAAIIISYRLFVPPVIGIADNGDFARFFTAGLDHVPAAREDKYFYFFNSKYRIVEAKRPGRYLSSSELSIRIARWAGVYLIDDKIFDIRLVGGLYAVLLLFGLYLLLVASRPLAFAARLMLAIFLLVVLTDASYVAGFNSFYSEPNALVFLLIAAGFALLLIAHRKSVWLLLGYFAASAMLVTSKPGCAPLAALLAPLGVYLSRESRKSLRVGVWLAVLLCVTAAVYYSRAPRWLRSSAAYIGVFTDLLPNSPTPERDLIDLGLPPEWAQFSGTTPYTADSPANDIAFQDELMAHVGATSLPRFYLSRPSRLYSLAARCSTHILTQTPLGYYEKESGRPPLSQPSGLWYGIRSHLFPKSVWTVFAFFAFGIVATVMGIVRGSSPEGRDLFILFGFVIAVAAVQFLVPILTLGEIDLDRYLILFNLVFDANLIILPMAAIQWLRHPNTKTQSPD